MVCRLRDTALLHALAGPYSNEFESNPIPDNLVVYRAIVLTRTYCQFRLGCIATSQMLYYALLPSYFRQ